MFKFILIGAAIAIFTLIVFTLGALFIPIIENLPV